MREREKGRKEYCDDRFLSHEPFSPASFDVIVLMFLGRVKRSKRAKDP